MLSFLVQTGIICVYSDTLSEMAKFLDTQTAGQCDINQAATTVSSNA